MKREQFSYPLAKNSRTYYGDKIFAARKKCGYTRVQIEERLGIPYMTILQYERNMRRTPEWLANMIIREIYRIASEDILEVKHDVR